MVHLVTLLQPAKDRDGVFDGRLADVDLLKTTLERGVFLHVGAVFVERRRADHSQLAAGEHRLHHVSGVHRTFGTAGTDQRVDLVDERDHLAAGIGDLLQHRLEAFFELTAVLRAGEHRRQVERNEALGLQALGHVARRDTLRQTFDDGRLSDAGFADEDRVVLRAAREHLHDATNLLVATDDGVDLAGASPRGEIDAVLLQRLKLVLGILRRHTVRASNLAQRGKHLFSRHADRFVHREHEHFNREVIVAEVRLQLGGRCEHRGELAVETRLRPALGARHLGERARALLCDRVHRHSDFCQQR